MANNIGKFLKESREELKKVVWPSREEVLNSTIVVLIAVIIVSLFLYSLDLTFEAAFKYLTSRGAGS